MKYIGAHVSIAGGVANAPLNAAAIGADAFALFTKNQRQWNAPPLSDEAVAAFKENCAMHGFSARQILPHDSYLINLGNPDPAKRANALKAFIGELERCRQLGLDRLNFHPGSHLNQVPEKEDIRLIAQNVRAALEAVPEVIAVYENTAGQGTNLGFRFEQLAEMLEQTAMPGRVGVCLDTCHAFAAGYDFSTPEGYEKSMAEFDRLIGFELLRGMHLNDAKGTLAGHLDRHDNLGHGNLGWEPFRRIVADPRIDGIPLILETPDAELWAEEIAALHRIRDGR